MTQTTEQTRYNSKGAKAQAPRHRLLRTVLLAGAVALTTPMAAPNGFLPHASASEVRSSRTIDSHKITLGDLFTGLSASDAATLVTRAPAPGGSVRFTASQLDQLALRYGIPLTMPLTFTGLTLTRSGDAASQDATYTQDTGSMLPVTLKPQPAVPGRDIMLGDVLSGYFDGRRHKIAEAGLPGDVTELNTAMIAKVAERYGLRVTADSTSASGLNGLPSSIQVKRLGTPLPAELLGKMIGSEISKNNNLRGARVDLMDYEKPHQIPIENSATDVYVAAVQLNNTRTRFEATLLLPAEGAVPRPVKIKGSLAFPDNALIAAALSGAESGDLDNIYSDTQSTPPNRYPRPMAGADRPETQATGGETGSGLTTEDRAIGLNQPAVTPVVETETRPDSNAYGRPALPEGETNLIPLESISVIDNAIRVGDLFERIPLAIADRTLFEAPKPGNSKYISIFSLKTMMKKMGYTLDAPLHIKRILIQREGMRLTRADIREVIDPHLKSEGLDGDYKINFTNSRRSIYLPLDADLEDIEVDSFDFRPGSNTFQAQLRVPTGGVEAQRVALKGRVEPMSSVPTLSRNVSPGDIIKASMISWRSMPTRNLRDAIYSEQDLIGRTVRRSVSAGNYLKSSNVERPRIVLKKNPVSMIYSIRGLKIQTVGMAMDDGALGQVISVMNMKSKTTIDARIIGPNLVEPITANFASVNPSGVGGSR